ncbi:hypothetical protein LUZ60_016477 [Juncus effusus]|nr:hypothetical protein LUZ60_016477 [Juncus effusus]
MRGFFFIFWLFFLLTTPTVVHSQALVKPGCQPKCGDVDIPYPFGLSPDCSMEGFQINCTMINGTYKPFVFNVEIQNILLPVGRARMKNNMSWECYNATSTTNFGSNWRLNFRSTPYRFSDVYNKFTTIGCETLAYIKDSDITKPYQSGCVSMCSDISTVINGSCSGIGCCQTTIPKDLRYYNVQFDPNFNSSHVWNFSSCSYAVLLEAAWFNFTSNFISTTNFFYKNHGSVPLVMDWAIGDETCAEAQANVSSYACVSKNSSCIESQNGPGYLCNCTNGYQGNPYLLNGCQDIDECVDESKCSGKGTCQNTPGSYICVCPSGTHSTSYSNGTCVPDQKLKLWVKLLIGICVGIVVLLLIVSFTHVANARRKLAKIREKYFQQYGGRMLLEEMKSKHGQNFTIFTEEELNKATNNFDKNNMIGQGGNGTVYKGTLENNGFVAIKKCKTMDERQKKEFGKEMLILSQINHKNIVKIRGCCLELEIPILVYEFISNGTLSDLIHAKSVSRISLKTRLRIAQEAAEALAYLHSWASPPIVHRDVKTPNILLDENFMAKVSDFGASVLAPIDQDQFATVVQGTRGYLDPEYVQSGQLTVKSDVYSFGVVLLELLTRKKAFYFEGPEEERSLSSRFLSLMKENKIEEILDDEIVNEEDLDLIKQVAKLAKECLNLDGEKRPEMKEVAEELARLRKTMKHPWRSDDHEEIVSLLPEGESSNTHEIELSDYYSLEKKAMLDIEDGR